MNNNNNNNNNKLIKIQIILNIYDLTKLNKFLLLHAIGLGAYHTVLFIIVNILKK